jgi:hypothetical protein
MPDHTKPDPVREAFEAKWAAETENARLRMEGDDFLMLDEADKIQYWAFYKVAYTQARTDLIAEMWPTLEQAADELKVCAGEIEAGHTINGEWPDSEGEALDACLRLEALADALIAPRDLP